MKMSRTLSILLSSIRQWRCGLRFTLFLVVAGLALGAIASAQWLKIPTPGIPRTPDGKPDLGAPAPKKADGRPDLSGMYQVGAKYLADIAADLKPGDVPFQPW